MRRVGNSNWFSFGVEKVDSKHVSNVKNRVADGVSCCFCLPFGHCCSRIKICSDSGGQIDKRDGR